MAARHADAGEGHRQVDGAAAAGAGHEIIELNHGRTSWGWRCRPRAGGAARTDLLETAQRLQDHFVGVEIAVLRQPAAEIDAAAGGLLVGEPLVCPVEGGAGGRRRRVVRLPRRRRRLVTDDRFGMALAGDVLHLDGSRIGKIIGVVDLHARLAVFRRVGHEIEAQGAVRQRAEAATEVVVDRPGVDRGPARPHQPADLAERAVEQHADLAVAEHPGKQGGKAAFRHHLKTMVHVAAVAVEAHRDAAADFRRQLARMQSPLLQRVMEVKGLVKVFSNAAQHKFFGIPRALHGAAQPGEEPLRRSRIQCAAEELFERGEVDREREKPAADATFHFVAGRQPFREARQVFQERGVVGAEVVRAVVVDQDAVGVARVVAVAGDMPPLIDDEDVPAEDGRRPFGDNAAGRPSPAHQKVHVIQHEGVLGPAAVRPPWASAAVPRGKAPPPRRRIAECRCR